ncbi:hypothetical protein, partial [Myxococcus qinghaiensis]|uniref:hypothetical protein n=1 Tax=Myxococcus qinghaiensis TaxID=2906758 RepID=UPI0020A81A49
MRWYTAWGLATVHTYQRVPVPGAYSGDGEHPFQLKPSSRSGHGEQSERQRRWDVLSLHLLASLR